MLIAGKISRRLIIMIAKQFYNLINHIKTDIMINKWIKKTPYLTLTLDSYIIWDFKQYC